MCVSVLWGSLGRKRKITLGGEAQLQVAASSGYPFILFHSALARTKHLVFRKAFATHAVADSKEVGWARV